MSGVVSGHITAFFLYDVAEAIDLAGLQRKLGAGVASRLTPKPTTPPYVQYRQPPITIDGHVIDMGEADGFTVRFKAFDYGVVSVAMTRRVAGSWDEWVSWGRECYENAALPRSAEQLARTLVSRIAPTVTRLRPDFLTEDYLVFTVTELDEPASAEALLASRGGAIVQLLRGERSLLSLEERDEVLRHRVS